MPKNENNDIRVERVKNKGLGRGEIEWIDFEEGNAVIRVKWQDNIYGTYTADQLDFILI